MNNRFTWIVIGLIIAFGGFVWFNKSKTSAPGNSGATGQVSNHTYGEGKKGVKLVEYADFQCPACAAYYPIVKQLKEKYKSDITFQFVNFPLTQIHQNAMAAHRVAEAAHKQGKFWEMHDLLYENQQSWSDSSNPTPIFETFATQLGLNIGTFKQDVASQETNAVINADIQAAKNVGANSTPTFVLDGKKIDENPRDLDAFSKLIDDAIAAKN